MLVFLIAFVFIKKMSKIAGVFSIFLGVILISYGFHLYTIQLSSGEFDGLIENDTDEREIVTI